MNDTLLITIKNPDAVIFDGEAKALSSLNEAGPFDVLGEHANFISIVKEFLTVHNVDGTTQKFKIESGILQVLSNRVVVFLGIETLAVKL